MSCIGDHALEQAIRQVLCELLERLVRSRGERVKRLA